MLLMHSHSMLDEDVHDVRDPRGQNLICNLKLLEFFPWGVEGILRSLMMSSIVRHWDKIDIFHFWTPH
jgi:hypothetical protein